MKQSATSRPLGIVIVGGGFIAEQHARAIQENARTVLVGAVDVAAGRARSFADAFGGVRHTSSLDEALGWDGVDACIICTPNDSHHDIGAVVAKNAKHLLMEKPFALSTSEAQDLVSAFVASGATVMPAHTHRFSEYGQTVKSVLQSGQIGKPVLIRLAMIGGWIWPDWRAWILDPERSGGHEFHNGVHLLDLVAWWMDLPVVSVHARGQRITSSDLEIYDYIEMVVGFEGGGTAVCEISRAHAYGEVSERDVLVLGTEGELRIPMMAESSTFIGPAGIKLSPVRVANPFATQLEAWLRHMTGAESVISAQDAIRSIAMAEAARESLRIEGPVQLPTHSHVSEKNS